MRRSGSLQWAGRRWMLLTLLASLALVSVACGNMADQPSVQPFEFSAFFIDGQSVRPEVKGAVPRAVQPETEWLESGQTDGEQMSTVPVEPTAELLAKGREQFEIYCAPCHGISGDGDGPVVQNGFPAPRSLHSDELRQAPAGYYFDVITDGSGDMFSYAARVEPEARWAIIAYIRALQLSRQAPADLLDDSERQQLDENDG